MRYLSFVLLSFLMLGCTSEQLSNLSIEREVYCATTADSVDKELAIAAIREEIPYYPAGGLCTDFGQEYLEASAEYRRKLIEARDEAIQQQLDDQLEQQRQADDQQQPEPEPEIME